MDRPTLQNAANIESNIAMINDVIRNANPADTVYYRGVLSGLQHQLAEIKNAQRAQAVPGPSGTYRTHPPSHTNLSSSVKVESSTTPRKRSLEPTQNPEAKRPSRQPSPVASGSHTNGFQQAARPVPIVDLTVSNPPTPDPFPELANAYQSDDARSVPAHAHNQTWMELDELARFLDPAFQDTEAQSMLSNPVLQAVKKEIPYLPRSNGLPWDPESDSDDYDNYPLAEVETEAIEKLLENIKEHGETPEDRERTPKIMRSTLKEYQKIGLTWLLKMENGNSKGGVLADEMGLGKTVRQFL